LLRLGKGSRLGLLYVAFVEDGLCQLDEGRFDVDVGLGRGFQKFDIVLFGYGISSLLRHYSLILHVTLVAEDHPFHVLIGVLVNVPQPLSDIIKGLGVGNVVDQHDTHGTTVVTSGDGVEPLLTRGVPDLQFDFLPSKLNSLDLEVDSNRGDEGCVKCVLRKSE